MGFPQLEGVNFDQAIVLARHGSTHKNKTRFEPDGLVQGASLNEPLSPEGCREAWAFGQVLGRFAAANSLRFAVAESSRAVRASDTREIALHAAQLNATVPQTDPTRLLDEMRKGELEGMTRKVAYPNGDAAYRTDWLYRHGSQENGGENAYEAAGRWLTWQRSTEISQIETVLAFGHNLITSYGLARLLEPSQTAPGTDLQYTRKYKADNGTGILLLNQRGKWTVHPERIAPEAEDIAAAEEWLPKTTT